MGAGADRFILPPCALSEAPPHPPGGALAIFLVGLTGLDRSEAERQRVRLASVYPVGLEASGRLVGPPVFKTGVPARAGRRVRFPSASATP